MAATIVGHEIDWFRSETERVFVRFRINREDRLARQRPANDKLVMLRNAYANNKQSLLYPNAILVTEGAFISVDIVVRGNEGDVGCGFSIMTGASRGSRDAVDRPIAEKSYALGPASSAGGGGKLWHAEHIRRLQGTPNLIGVDPLGSLVSGNRTTADIAALMPRSQINVHAWPVRMYNDLDFGESYYKDYPPPGDGPSIFPDGSPKLLKDIDGRGGLAPTEGVVLGAVTPKGVSEQQFGRIEIQEEQRASSSILGFLNVQLFALKTSI
jgi:hypothetical protein